MEDIKLIAFKDEKASYDLMNKWCSKEYVYEWFEQRKLSYSEIKEKYQKKLLENKQKLFFISYHNKNIGFVQIYRYEDNDISILNKDSKIYEYDIFIGEKEYLSKGIGTQVVNYVNEYIDKNYACECILLRPCKRNIRAIKCYQKAGFNIIGETNDLDTVGHKEVFVIMIKNLGVMTPNLNKKWYNRKW